MLINVNNLLKLENLLECIDKELLKTEHISNSIDSIKQNFEDILFLPYILSIVSLRTMLQETYKILEEIYSEAEKSNND